MRDAGRGVGGGGVAGTSDCRPVGAHMALGLWHGQWDNGMGRSGPPPPGPANTGRSSRGRCYPDEAEVPLPYQVPQPKPCLGQVALYRLVPSLGL